MIPVVTLPRGRRSYMLNWGFDGSLWNTVEKNQILSNKHTLSHRPGKTPLLGGGGGYPTALISLLPQRSITASITGSTPHAPGNQPSRDVPWSWLHPMTKHTLSHRPGKTPLLGGGGGYPTALISLLPQRSITASITGSTPHAPGNQPSRDVPWSWFQPMTKMSTFKNSAETVLRDHEMQR
ncbi:hypothetical protein Syun_009769 [Stephania yunnanensis]|uniref:Uncharacterized protein n=1 Tax=Stephania yunnanensis TaxID=152371 RepID=A0AAP0KG76_9MAGN